ncbi:MAG: ankyrin repeat domain-containing protein [Alphaproteobacteria bacterium]|nr:ankyrin repeat domain-containing protein [Alphaproteobacteria bacterium]
MKISGLIFAVALLSAVQAKASVRELIESVKQNNLPGVLELLDNGENVNAANEQGNTALHYAVATDNADITQVLLAYGANLEAANSKGWTPLSIAEKKQLKNVTPIIAKALEERKEAALIKEKLEQTKATAATAQQNAKAAVAQAQQKVEEPIVAAQKQAENAAIEVQKRADAAVANAQKQAATATANTQEKVGSTAAKVQELAKQNVLNLQENTDKSAQKVVVTKEDNKVVVETVKTPATEPIKSQAPVKPTVTAAKKPAVAAAKKQMAVAKPQKPVLIKSTINDKIYAGDEEIVYCLNYLGHGENASMLHGSGFFAASAGISENRYHQITDAVAAFLGKATSAELAAQNKVCGQVITPKNKDKQNQIIRSINRAIGM